MFLVGGSVGAGGSVDAKQSVVSKLGNWENFDNLRWEGCLPAEYDEECLLSFWS